MRPFGKVEIKAMRVNAQSGQYHTIVKVVIPNTPKFKNVAL